MTITKTEILERIEYFIPKYQQVANSEAPNSEAKKAFQIAADLFSDIKTFLQEPDKPDVKAVARAICRTDYTDYDDRVGIGGKKAIDKMVEAEWNCYIQPAKVAISAMPSSKPSIWKQYPNEKPDRSKQIVRTTRRPMTNNDKMIIKEWAGADGLEYDDGENYWCYESDLIVQITGEPK